MSRLRHLPRKVAKRIRDLSRGRRNAIFLNPIRGVKGNARILPDTNPNLEDILIARRLLDSYNFAKGLKSENRRQDIWSVIEGRQNDFFALLDADSPEQLAIYLSTMNRQSATEGTVQGRSEYLHIKRSFLYRRRISRIIQDKLVALGEAVGAIACENPEQGVWARNILLSPEDLMVKISDTLGIDITPPSNVDAGLLKIVSSDPTKNFSIGERDCNAIYTAWYISKILGPSSAKANLCEIGGGIGRVAYWATQLGVQSYSIIDLPHINVLQGFYLIKALGADRVTLFGEPVNNPFSGIFILPNHIIRESQTLSPPDRYHLVLNQDSFPEINKSEVNDYLSWIHEKSNLFLSINHESEPNSFQGAFQNNVPALVRDLGGYKLVSRNKYWLRKGYVTELYDVT